jgi:hypothetical protein
MTRSIVALLISITFVLMAASAFAFTPAHLWSQRFGSMGNDSGQWVAVDGSGNVFVTGYFNGTVDFGGGGLVSAGSEDIFLAKYDAAGVHLWSQRFGSTSYDRGNSVAVDGLGNVFVTGYFNGTVDFGGGGLVSAGSYDIFLAKYNADGVYQWSQRFGSTGMDIGNSVAVDGLGNVFVTGYFNGTVDFGGGGLVSAGSFDIFLAKYNAAGAHQWSQRFGNTGSDYGYSVAVDGSANIFVTGSFWGTVNFGGGNLVSAGAGDVFFAKYNSSGTHQWSRRFGSTSSDFGNCVAADGSGNVFVTGYFEGTVDFGGGGLVSAGGWDIFLAKYDASGGHQWSQRFGSTSTDRGWSVAVDGSGGVFMPGNFSGTVDFGGGGLVSAGSYDIFLAKYNANGVHQWSQRFGNTGGDVAYSVAVNESGNVLATGVFAGAVDFGGATFVSAGGNDLFLAQYSGNAAEPLITSIVDIGNDQGRRVKIRFSRSGGDDGTASNPVTSYEAYRRDDAPPATAAGSRNPVVLSERELLDEGWTQAGTVAAHAQSSYGIDVTTIADSTIALGQYYSTFFIRAATGEPATYFDSPPDSGWSVDNLAPGVPGSLAYNTGVISWDESTAEDFDYFTVYGANADDFGSATVVDYTVDPTMDVTASPYVFYFVTATDFSGNEGRPAKVNTLSGVGGTPASYVLSVSNHPNPFNPRTTVSYTVPSRGTVTVAIFDARGARVATLVNGEERDAGAYRVEWDGRAGNGPAASGIYFARIEHAGATRSKKMLLLK